MATKRQIEANRENARKSTGPRSATGKSVVARNAIYHGIFTQHPVLPGELAEAWDEHRAALVEAFSPADAVEALLVDRLALIFWRLRRVLQFEVAVSTAAQEREALPLPHPQGSTRQPMREDATPEERVETLREQIERDRNAIHSIVEALAVIGKLGPKCAEEAVPSEVADMILQAAQEIVHEYDKSDVERKEWERPHSTDGYLGAVAMRGVRHDESEWPLKLIWEGVGGYDSQLGWQAGQLVDEVRTRLEVERVLTVYGRKGRRAELRDLDRFVARSQAWRQAELLLPVDRHEAKVMRYETHLHRQAEDVMNRLDHLRAGRERPARRGELPRRETEDAVG